MAAALHPAAAAAAACGVNWLVVHHGAGAMQGLGATSLAEIKLSQHQHLWKRLLLNKCSAEEIWVHGDHGLCD